MSSNVSAVKNYNKQSAKGGSNTSFDCNKCGTKHKRRECPAFNRKCNKCSGMNHFAKFCPSREKINAKARGKSVNTVLEDSDAEDDLQSLHIWSVQNQEEDDWFELVQTDTTKFSAKLDTGAQCNVLPHHIAVSAGADINASRTKSLICYSEKRMKVLGEATLNCTIKDVKAAVVFKIVNEKVTPILGRKSCVELGLVARVKSLREAEGIDNVFSGIGCLRNFEYDIDIIDNPKLKIHPARRIPYSIREQVKQELDKMVELDIIKPTKEPTPIVSPMVIARRNNKMRICMDPSDLNRNIRRRHFPLCTL